MFRNLVFLCFTLLSFPCSSQVRNSDQVLDAMLKKYTGHWCKTFTFTQSTYRPNDSLNTRMVWFEAIDYPDRLRIDFNSITRGNAALFRNDTSYRFRKGVLQETRPDQNDLLLILGGMYFRPKEEVVKRLAGLGYNLDVLSENTWKGKPVYVIGAPKGDSTSNQLWVDKTELLVVRTISHLNPGELMEMRVQSFIPCCGGFSPTKLSFYINGKLDQQETYDDLQTNVALNPAIFDPVQFGKVHWKKPSGKGPTK